MASFLRGDRPGMRIVFYLNGMTRFIYRLPEAAFCCNGKRGENSPCLVAYENCFNRCVSVSVPLIKRWIRKGVVAPYHPCATCRTSLPPSLPVTMHASLRCLCVDGMKICSYFLTSFAKLLCIYFQPGVRIPNL